MKKLTFSTASFKFMLIKKERNTEGKIKYFKNGK